MTKIPQNKYITLNPPLVATHPKSLILLFYLSTMLCVAVGWSYYFIVLAQPWMIFVLPLEIFGIAYVFILSSLFFAKIAVKILERKFPPREGVFERDGPEMNAYQARNFFKYYAIWLTRNSTFPWIDKIAYSLFGVPVGQTVVLHEAWVDTEMVSIGDFCMVGMGSIVMSHMLYPDKFFVKKTIIEPHTIVGAYSVLAPGTHLRNSSVLGASSGTIIDQEFEERAMYAGSPAKKIKDLD
ncbi:MAG: hypothetical protein ACFFCS_18765 [Candidatus Hodarchaeota archaeon]